MNYKEILKKRKKQIESQENWIIINSYEYSIICETLQKWVQSQYVPVSWRKYPHNKKSVHWGGIN